MPRLRGIEISVAVQPESLILPEFPHPEASPVCLKSPDKASPSLRASRSSAFDIESTHIPKINPKVSVYIPSIPGTRFWIRYSVQRALEPPGCFFFKLFMNGRNVANWGADPGVTSGIITRALHEPSDRWNFKQGGILLRRTGIESRFFFFALATETITIADDGGLIEVQVFRARSRRRRTPNLSKHRNQDQYGIKSPSGGLVDRPEDMVYYDWVLDDPTYSPFASFQFHYRSWTYLCELNLISYNANSSTQVEDVLQLLKSRDRGLQMLDNQGLDALQRGGNDTVSMFRSVSRQGMTGKTSLRAHALFHASALLPYIEEEDEDDLDVDEDVEYAKATKISIQFESMGETTSGGHRPLPNLPRTERSRVLMDTSTRHSQSYEADNKLLPSVSRGITETLTEGPRSSEVSDSSNAHRDSHSTFKT
ncbi:hypothetical protein PT974_04245 [Cladobotryum mycophilum]|uniref:Uncharacterized protein n=1 Tax=Cladobotryum mycophilum TaxID=491253 RepID=A0ABR0SUN2_9HYPO